MALKLTNTSEKVIGVGNVAVLPGKTEEVPPGFENNPVLNVYSEMGLIILSGKDESYPQNNGQNENRAGKPDEVTNEDAESDKKAKIAALKDASDEDVAKWANELGINPAECKDQADVRKKVKAALSK